MHVWVSSESNILTEALVQFVSRLGFEAHTEQTSQVEVALLHLGKPAPPFPAPPALPTLALTSSQVNATKLLQHGYRGHLDMGASAETLKRALNAVHNGEIWANRETLTRLLEDLTHPELTRRETEVLALVAQGLSNRTIAARLGIAERTVKTHVANLFEKFRVKSRVQLALHLPRRLEPFT